MENVRKKHTDIHDLSVFNEDQIDMRTNAIIDGVKYLGQDVIVNGNRIGNFAGQYCINRTDTMLENINAKLVASNIDTSDVEIVDKKWNWGGVNSRTITFNKEVIQPKQGDFVKAQITLINSYDGSRKASICFGLMRLVCENGMVALDANTGVQAFRKHTNNDVFENEYNKISMFKEAVDGFDAQLQSYANTVVSLDVVRDTLKNTIAKNEVKENQIMEYVESNNRGSVDTIDLYSVYNGVTEWATHHEARKTADLNNVYLSRQMDVTKFLQSNNFTQLAA
mgnify:FL=1